MNRLTIVSLGLVGLVGFEIANAEILTLESNQSIERSPVVKERDTAIERANIISKNMMAKSELDYIKVIAQAEKDKIINDAEAVKLKEIAKAEAIMKASIITAKEKAKVQIREINKEVKAIQVNANYLYEQKIKEAKSKLQPVLSQEKEYTIENLEELLKNNTIKFVVGSQTLTKTSIMQIKEIATLLKGLDKYIQIEGYTDSDGSSILNKKLSLARAKKVKRKLVSLGVKSRNISAIGYGELHPLVPNTTPENKAKNRRIVLKIVK